MIPLANLNQPNPEIQAAADLKQPVAVVPVNNSTILEEFIDFVIFGFIPGAFFMGFKFIFVCMVRYLLI